MAFNIADASVRITAQTAGEEEVARLTTRLQALGAETKKANSAQVIGAAGDGQRRASMVMLGQQIGDVGMQMQMGTSMAMIFAQQAGQTGYALAGMGGALGKVGGFLAGPWGAALTVGISMLGMLVSKLGEAEEASKDLKMVNDALATAQGALGNMFDLTTGKIKNNTEAMRLNMMMQSANLRAEAMRQQSTADQATEDAGQYSYGALVSGNIPLRKMFDVRNTAARQLLKDVQSGKVKTTDAFARAQKMDFKGVDIDKQGFLDAIASVARANSSTASADLIDKALSTNTLPSSLYKPKKERKVGEKADPYGDIMLSLGGDVEQLKFREDALAKHGEKLASTKEVLIAYNIEQGKYGKLSEKQSEDLLNLAIRYDTATTAVKMLEEAERKRKQIAEKTDREIEKTAAAQVGYQAELDALRDTQLQLTMTSFEYGLYIDRKRRLAQIDQEVIGWEESTAEAHRKAAVEALDGAEALQRLNEAKDNTFGAGKENAIYAYGEEIANVGRQAFDAWTNALNATEDALVNFVMTGKLGFKDLATSIIGDITRIAIRQAIMKPLLGALGLKVPGFADGGAFVNGVQKFANGGVVSSPTLFPMAKGAGLMGEAGPEAIMPLKRLANGRLGVEAGGGGGNNIVVNVNVEDGQSQVSGDPGSAGALGKVIANAVRNELVTQKRPGGLLAA